ncbi:MAG: phosphodiester glycosidase family protein, partial [Anaerolineales bacterium]
LSQGAQVVLMHGDITDRRTGKGVYGGDDARIKGQSLNKFWQELSSQYPDAFCVLNGQFFYMKESPTRLPFPLKVDSAMVSDGYGLNEFPDNKMLLEIWPEQTRITPLSYESLYGSTAPDIVAGLTQTANKRSDSYTGRTFVGVDDRDQNGSAEILLIFNSKISRQVDAASVLQSFGADQVMMLDGGGSTQLICQGEALVSSDRPIPQAIGVVAAANIPAPLQDTVISPDPAEGEAFSTADQNLQPAEIQEQAPEIVTPDRFNFSDIVWVPIAMMPVFAVLAVFVNRLRSQLF